MSMTYKYNATYTIKIAIAHMFAFEQPSSVISAFFSRVFV